MFVFKKYFLFPHCLLALLFVSIMSPCLINRGACVVTERNKEKLSKMVKRFEYRGALPLLRFA